MNPSLPTTLAIALQAFFSDHLPRLRGMSPHTLASYRDSLALFLRFAAEKPGRPVETLDVEHIQPDEVPAFLDHLESKRHNAISTRNVRLAALHAFFRFLAARHPEHIERAQRVLAIPFKRSSSRPIEYLEYDEIAAVLAAIDRSQTKGRRDYALLALMFNTGARVQEIVSLHAHDLQLTKPFQVRLLGKGRKERFCPLWPQTAQVLRIYCAQRQLDLRSDAWVFANHRGEPLTRFGVRYLLATYLDRAKVNHPTLARKRLHPHSLRHSTAVHLLKSGVDLCTISQWLGHASPNTTNRYATVDLEMKRQAIARAKPIRGSRTVPSWRRNNTILHWLEAL